MGPKLSFRKWCLAMEDKPPGDYRGLIHLSNLLFDCKRGRIKPSLVRSFGEYVVNVWSGINRPGMTLTPPETLLDAFVKTDYAGYCGQGRPIADPKSPPFHCSRVMKVNDLYNFNIDKNRRMRRLNRSGNLPLDAVQELIKNGNKAAMGPMSGKHKPITWVTKTKVLDDLRVTHQKDPLAYASVVVSKLGLEHQAKMPYLIEVVYPLEVSQSDALRSPTILDNAEAENLIYRSDEFALTRDGWGSAVDIEHSTQGAPEAICRKVPFTIKFQLRDIGVATARRNCDYARVFEHCSEPWILGINLYRKINRYCYRRDRWK